MTLLLSTMSKRKTIALQTNITHTIGHNRKYLVSPNSQLLPTILSALLKYVQIKRT